MEVPVALSQNRKISVDYVHNVQLQDVMKGFINRASVWITFPEYWSQKNRSLPWFAQDLENVADAIRIVGPVDHAVAKQVYENLLKALAIAGVDVVADETADD